MGTAREELLRKCVYMKVIGRAYPVGCRIAFKTGRTQGMVNIGLGAVSINTPYRGANDKGSC